MASVQACRDALLRLGDQLASVEAPVRERHVPARSVSCRVTDLDVGFVGRVDADGLHELDEVGVDDLDGCDVKTAVSSEVLVALADGRDSLISAWLHGRLQVSAPMRDLLRLRTLIGM